LIFPERVGAVGTVSAAPFSVACAGSWLAERSSRFAAASCRSGRSVLLGCALGAAAGVFGGYAPPNGPDDRLKTRWPAPGSAFHGGAPRPARPRRRRLHRDGGISKRSSPSADVSKLILRSVRAHGGWDAWRHSGKLVITRVREAVAAPAGQDGSPPPRCDRAHRRSWWAPTGAWHRQPRRRQAARRFWSCSAVSSDRPRVVEIVPRRRVGRGSGAGFRESAVSSAGDWPSIGDASRCGDGLFSTRVRSSSAESPHGRLALRRSRVVRWDRVGGLQLATRRKICSFGAVSTTGIRRARRRRNGGSHPRREPLSLAAEVAAEYPPAMFCPRCRVHFAGTSPPPAEAAGARRTC
jgi:hypothetical protein